jgi:hypothetical protein
MPLLNRLEVSAGDEILPFHLINRCATSSKLARHFRAGCSVSGAWHLMDHVRICADRIGGSPPQREHSQLR